MTKNEQGTITIEKKREMRTSEIANMISEGGTGAENYYIIKKTRPASDHEQSEEQH